MKTSICPLSITTGIATLISLIGSRSTLRRPGSSFSRSAARSKRRAISSNGLMWWMSSRWPPDAISDVGRTRRLLARSLAGFGASIVVPEAGYGPAGQDGVNGRSRPRRPPGSAGSHRGHPLVHLLRRDVLLVRGDAPLVAERIDE